MKQFTTLKRIWSLFLTLAMVVAMGVTTLPAYAATGGTISVKYEPNGVSISEPTQFELYKVGNFGHFDDGKVSIDLTPDFATCGVDLNDIAPLDEDATEEDKDAWNNKWLAKASDLESWVKGAKDKPATIWEGALASGSSQILTEGGAAKQFNNGIYLLIGYEQKVGEYYWAPVPVLMMVLNNNVTFDIVDSASGSVVKTVKRPVAYKHVLNKIWDDKGHEDARPKTIKVDILYAGKVIDTVTLGDKEAGGIGSWTYTWYSQEAEGRYYASKGITTEKLNENNGYKIDLPQGDGVWNVSEQQTDDLKYYTWSLEHKSYVDYKTSSQQTDGSGQEPAEGSGDAEPAEGSGDGTSAEGGTAEQEKPDADYIETFNLTNKFETRRVRIKKHLINYLNHNDGKETYANATVAFDVKGYIGDSTTPVYHNQVGMTFKNPGNQEIVLNNIPVKVTRVVVEEIYSTNYEVVGDNPIEKDITKEGDVVIEKDTLADGTTIDCPTFIFEFENDYDGPPKYGSGVVNKYDKGTDNDYHYEPNADTSGIYKPQN